jgi:hypothetical protein
MTFSPKAIEAACEAFMGTNDLLGKQMEAALSAALAVDGMALQGWRPIDSAPEDGRYIITGSFRDDELKWVKHSRWMSAEEACEEEGGASADDYDAGWTDGEDEHDYCYPTHWQPLPPPPAASDREERRPPPKEKP